MKISVIIPTYNRKELLRNLLRSMEDDHASRSAAELEVIVADDRSTDGTGEMLLSEFPWVRPIQGPGKDGELARRAAIQLCSGEYIVSLDDDCIPRPGWVAAALPALERGEKIVQAKLIFLDLDQQDVKDESPANFRNGFRFDMMPLAQLNGGYRPQYLEFCHEFGCFYAREVLEKTPLDDPNLVGDKFGSSASFSLRARQFGYRVFFEPSAVIDHLGAEIGGFKERTKKTPPKKNCTPYVINLVHNFFIFGRLYRPRRIPILILYYFAGGLYLSIKQKKNCLQYFLKGMYNGLRAPILPVIPYEGLSLNGSEARA